MRVPEKKFSVTNDIWLEAVSTENYEAITLRDDLVLKISSLLMEGVGSTRNVSVHLTDFELDSDLTANAVEAVIRLTRLNTSVLAHGNVSGSVTLECVRCLNQFEQPFSTTFAEEFRQVESLGGHGFNAPDDDFEEDESDEELAFEINDAHEIDLTEMLRQHILLALPMNPICGKDCPGPEQVQNNTEDQIDARFAALQDLLDNEDE